METYGHARYARNPFIYNVQEHPRWLRTARSTEWYANIASREKRPMRLAHLLMKPEGTEMTTPPLIAHMMKIRETPVTQT